MALTRPDPKPVCAVLSARLLAVPVVLGTAVAIGMVRSNLDGRFYFADSGEIASQAMR